MLGRFILQHMIDRIATGAPFELIEMRKLVRTLKRHAADVLG